MDERTTFFASDAPQLAAVLMQRWSGTRINRLHLHLDERREHSKYAGQLSIDFSISGDEDALVNTGLIGRSDIESLARCGSGRRRGVYFKRGKNGHFCLNIHIHDPPRPDQRAGRDEELMNVLVSALVPAIWAPPTASA